MSSSLCPEEIEQFREQFRTWYSGFLRLIKSDPALGEIYMRWEPARCRSLDLVEQCCNSPDPSALFFGAIGAGKTTSAVHVAIQWTHRQAWLELIKERCLPEPEQWLYAWTAPMFFSATSSVYGEQGDRARTLVDRSCHARLLIMDNFGNEGGGADAVAACFEVANYRYAHGKPVLITASIEPEKWNGYRNGALACCADRWHESCTWIGLQGESLRGGTRTPV